MLENVKKYTFFFFLKENQFAMHTVWQGVRGRDLRYACTCVPTIDSLTDYHYLTEKNGRAYQDSAIKIHNVAILLWCVYVWARTCVVIHFFPQFFFWTQSSVFEWRPH